jgi:hypothetical protein
VISGSLKFRSVAYGGLHKGDCAYFDSSIPHGMIVSAPRIAGFMRLS